MNSIKIMLDKFDNPRCEHCGEEGDLKYKGSFICEDCAEHIFYEKMEWLGFGYDIKSLDIINGELIGVFVKFECGEIIGDIRISCEYLERL